MYKNESFEEDGPGGSVLSDEAPLIDKKGKPRQNDQ